MEVSRLDDATALIVYRRYMFTEARSMPKAPCCPPAVPMPPVPADALEADEQLARLAKALGHPARVSIIRLLVRQEGCIVGDIVGQLPLAQSTVSQHLKQLKDAGLIRGEVDGPRVCYCVEPGAVALFKTLVQGL
ncbi:MAG: DNA-binding transcriptional ArsR family regulator [Myxococcota bacterium]|jgi:DNA-binding transcriptional ArsR family regulator